MPSLDELIALEIPVSGANRGIHDVDAVVVEPDDDDVVPVLPVVSPVRHGFGRPGLQGHDHERAARELPLEIAQREPGARLGRQPEATRLGHDARNARALGRGHPEIVIESRLRVVEHAEVQQRRHQRGRTAAPGPSLRHQRHRQEGRGARGPQGVFGRDGHGEEGDRRRDHREPRAASLWHVQTRSRRYRSFLMGSRDRKMRTNRVASSFPPEFEVLAYSRPACRKVGIQWKTSSPRRRAMNDG